MKKILVTGAAGFIGYHLCESLLKDGCRVIGLDSVDDYYDINLKFSRLEQLGIDKKSASVFGKLSKSDVYKNQMQFIRLKLEDMSVLHNLFEDSKFDFVCNLAAQAGVRYSLENPKKYIDSNICGFLNILECCRIFKIKRLVYASSSSVYGNSNNVPFEEKANVDNPISLYAATKKSNELMAHTYSHLYKIETIGLRFFTVYGPWGRPDMAMFLFTEAILNKKPIKVFNNGELWRDFTYIDDIINGVSITLLNHIRTKSFYNIYNIGNGFSVKLLDFINILEDELGINAIKEMLPIQPGDVNKTYANTQKLEKNYNYTSKTNLEKGIKQFISWYKNYYKIKL